MEKYFVFSHNEDSVDCEVFDKDGIEKFIHEADNCWFLNKMPNNLDELYPSDWSNYVIIKWNVVIPSAVQVVTKYEIE